MSKSPRDLFEVCWSSEETQLMRKVYEDGDGDLKGFAEYIFMSGGVAALDAHIEQLDASPLLRGVEEGPYE